MRFEVSVSGFDFGLRVSGFGFRFQVGVQGFGNPKPRPQRPSAILDLGSGLQVRAQLRLALKMDDQKWSFDGQN